MSNVVEFKPKGPSDYPDNPQELNELPGTLGMLQDYIFNQMSYPDRATAGLYAFSVMTMFVQTNNTIKSQKGLGFNEYYMGLAPTGFGKELIRSVATDTYLNAATAKKAPQLVFSAPSTKQGMHMLLEEVNRSLFMMADEFAGWMRASVIDGHKSVALDYIMEAYTKALKYIHPGDTKTVKYANVKHPRVSIMATSTGEAMFENLTRAQGDSGAYNRWVIFVGPTTLPNKIYHGLSYDLSDDLTERLGWLGDQSDESREKPITFSKLGFDKYVELDKKVAEQIKKRDAIMGGRLAEQAIKMAALIAMSDNRDQMSPEDVELAFKIRVGIYRRAHAALVAQGNIEGYDVTVKAVEQLRKAFERHNSIYTSQLHKHSRAYAKLSLAQQSSVQKALCDEGTCKKVGKQMVVVS